MSDDSNDGNELKYHTSEHVEANEELAYSIVMRIFHKSAAFLSDGSDLEDFICTPERDACIARTPTEHDIWSVEEAHERIEREYGVDVRPTIQLWSIAEQIALAK
jgi:hypothetical protein